MNRKRHVKIMNGKFYYKIIIVIFVIIASMFLIRSYTNNAVLDISQQNINEGNLRKIVFALVSSAENSSIDFNLQYSYIEDIGDGRGYTAGIIGFTSGTGDLLEVIKKYSELKKENILQKYIPALAKVNGSDSHEGLGEEFIKDWQTAAEDIQMIQAQNFILEQMYLKPAIDFANKDGLSVLGQFIYYDAIVVHGPGDEEESFNGIRTDTQNKCDTPINGESEKEYLITFLNCRSKIMKREEAHSDLSRINFQKKLVNEGNFELELPLEWSMYGDKFTLSSKELENL